MPRKPQTVEKITNSPKYAPYGGNHRFMQIAGEAIPYEAKMVKLITEFPISYRTAQRWYDRHQQEAKSGV